MQLKIKNVCVSNFVFIHWRKIMALLGNYCVKIDRFEMMSFTKNYNYDCNHTYG